MVQSILTFVSLAIGLALTLLYGPQSGIVMGFLVYLAGSNILLNRDVEKLKAHIDRIINELPELIREVVIKNEQKNQPSPSSKPAPSPQPATTEVLDQRIQALDVKLELLLKRMQTMQAMSSAEPTTVQTPFVNTAHASRPHTSPEPTPPAPNPVRSSQDIEQMRELLLKLAEGVMARNAQTTSSQASSHTHPSAPTVTNQNFKAEDETTHRRLTIEELRGELDKLAQELSIELGRPKS